MDTQIEHDTFKAWRLAFYQGGIEKRFWFQTYGAAVQWWATVGKQMHGAAIPLIIEETFTEAF